jgi:uncharacterized protein (TIGR02266 family)
MGRMISTERYDSDEGDELVALEEAIERGELVSLDQAVEPAQAIERIDLVHTAELVLGDLGDAADSDDWSLGGAEVRGPVEIDESVQLIAAEEVFARMNAVEQAKPPTGSERRVARRYSLVEPAVVAIASWSEMVALYTKDISCGGMFVQTDAPPEHETQVAVQLLLPDGAGALEFEGVVVHVVTAEQAEATESTAGFGLQFSDLTPERRRALQLFIEQAEVAATHAGATGPAPQARGSTALPSDRGSPLRLTLSEAEHQQLHALRAELAAMKVRGDLEVLGLQDAADLDELRDAFERQARRWHPSRVPRDAPSEIHRLVAEIFLRIEQAYRQLCDVPRSTAGVQSPASPAKDAASRVGVESAPPAPPPKAAPPAAVEPDAEKAQQRASRSARRTMDGLVERSEQLAAQLKRREPKPREPQAAPPRDEQRVLVDEALRLVAEKRYLEAIERLELALQSKPEPRLRVFLCVVQARQALTERDFLRARERYEAALQLDPSHELAQRELLMLSALKR